MVRILRWASCCFLLLAAQIWTNASAAALEREAASLHPAADRQPVVDGNALQFDSALPPRFQHVEMTLAAGVRFDHFRWNIAGTASGGKPNILSELEWSDVLSDQLTLGGRGQIGRHFYGRAQVNYAWIQSGSVRDSDYEGDDRTREYSRSISETDGDQVWDIVAGIGYPFATRDRRYFAAPMTGFSLHRQSFRITHGIQTISAYPPQTPPIGPLDSRLNSLYTADWRAFWLGGDLRYAWDVAATMAWELSVKYFFSADYSAKGNWNLRSDLQHPVSFEQDADAHGLCMQASWRMRLSRSVDMAFTFEYSRWKTDPGTDRVYTASGQTVVTRLNEVLWESNGVMLALAYRF